MGKMAVSVPVLRAALLAVVGASMLSACGGGGGSGDEPPPVPLPAPQLAFTAPGQSLDLANYSLAARYDLPAAEGADLRGVAASGVTYNGDTDTLFVIGDHGSSVIEVRKTGEFIGSMRFLKGEGEDAQASFLARPEGIAYLGSGQFVVVEERLRQIDRFTYVAGTALTPAGVNVVKLGKTTTTHGLEGISYDPLTSGFILVREKGPLGIFQAAIDFETRTASNGSPETENSTNLFAPNRAGVADFGDVWALANTLASTAADRGDLLVLSEESGLLLKMNRDGKVLSRLDVGQLPQHEGVTTDRDGKLYLINEAGGGVGRSQLWVYEPTHGASDVGIDSRLYLSFETPINPGAGQLTISNGSDDVRTIALDDAEQLRIDGNVLVVQLSEPLRPLATYTVQAPASLVKARPASTRRESAAFSLSFTTRNETRPPMLTGTAPVDNAVSVTGNRITLSFSEPVKAGSGKIVVSGADGDVRNIAIDDASQIGIADNGVEIRPNPALHAGVRYNVQIAGGVIVDLAGNAYSGIAGDRAFDFTMGAIGTQPQTELAAGDLLFLGINGDTPEAFAFILMRDIVAGTPIGFTDRDYNAATQSFPANEAAFIWSADADYAAGTVVTLQVGSVLVADRGVVVGRNGGGISTDAETYYAFRGRISAAGAIELDRFLAAINIGDAAGDLPPGLDAAGSYIHFDADNARFSDAYDRSDLALLRTLVRDSSNWEVREVGGFELGETGSMFPPP